PAVWNTSMVFFQALLLVGYSYAHGLTTWLTPRRQLLIHAFVLLLPCIALPIAVADTYAPPGEAHPLPYVLLLLTVTVGLPFGVVSTSAPLLQKWFALTGDPSSKDPYFLYAASNLGSMVALLGYPFAVEPAMTLLAQGWFWTAAYGLL